MYKYEFYVYIENLKKELLDDPEKKVTPKVWNFYVKYYTKRSETAEPKSLKSKN